MSKKLVNGLGIAMLAVALISTGAVFAAEEEIPSRGPRDVSPGYELCDEEDMGLLEEYMVQYVAEELDINAEEIQGKLDEGLTLTQVLLDYGVEDVWSMADAAHAYAVEQLAADGIEFPGWQISGNRGAGREDRPGMGRSDSTDRLGRNRQ